MSEASIEEGKKSMIWLVVLLFFLVLMIIGLVIGVVFLNTDGEGGEKIDLGENCKYEDDAHAMSVCVEETFEEDGSGIETFRSQYKKLIGEAIDEQKIDVATDLIINRARFLVVQERCEDYKALSSDDSYQGFEDIYLGKIYSYYIDFSKACGSEEDANKWSQELLIVNERNTNALGF